MCVRPCLLVCWGRRTSWKEGGSEVEMQVWRPSGDLGGEAGKIYSLKNENSFPLHRH